MIVVLFLTFANFAIMGLAASYKGVEYMDSAQFCGKTCHTVMQPEYTAYLDSPHSRVGCVECHIGPGAAWFVKGKICGLGQVFAVAFNTYSNRFPPRSTISVPRATPASLPLAPEVPATRIACGSNTPTTEEHVLDEVFLIKIGGGTAAGPRHPRPAPLRPTASTTRPPTTTARRSPWWPTSTTPAKRSSTLGTDAKPTPRAANAERRKMDCMDCHNRPTHAFDIPDRGVDKAMRQRHQRPNCPSKRKAVEILKANYLSRDEAAVKIPAAYREVLPGRSQPAISEANNARRR